MQKRYHTNSELVMNNLRYDPIDIAKIIVISDLKVSAIRSLLLNVFTHEKQYLIEPYDNDFNLFVVRVDHWISMLTDKLYRDSIPEVIHDLEELGKTVPESMLNNLEFNDINLTFKRLRLLSLFINERKSARIKLSSLLDEYGIKRRSKAFLEYLGLCLNYYKLTPLVSKKKCDISTIALDSWITFKATS